MGMTRDRWPFLKILISLLLAGTLVYVIGVPNLISTIQLLPFPIIVALILLALLTLFINSLAVWVLYRSVSSISFSQFLPAFLSSWAAGFFVPGKIGSLSITVLLKDEVKPGASAAIFIIDKVITVVLSILIGGYFLYYYLAPDEWLIPIGLSAGAFLVGCAILFTTQGRGLIQRILGKKSAFFTGFAESLPKFTSNPAGIILNGILTLARSGVQAVSLLLIFTSVGYPVSWVDMFAFSSMEVLASLIPITLSGIGLREVVLATMSTQVGIPFTTGAAAGLIMTIVMLIIVIPGILAFDEKKWVRNPKK